MPGYEKNRCNHRLDVPHHIAGIEPNHAQSLVPQPSVASPVSRRIVTHPMAVTVDLYDQFSSRAVEVEGVRPQRMLLAKLQSVGSLPQKQP